MQQEDKQIQRILNKIIGLDPEDDFRQNEMLLQEYTRDLHFYQRRKLAKGHDDLVMIRFEDDSTLFMVGEKDLRVVREVLLERFPADTIKYIRIVTTMKKVPL